MTSTKINKSATCI